MASYPSRNQPTIFSDELFEELSDFSPQAQDELGIGLEVRDAMTQLIAVDSDILAIDGGERNQVEDPACRLYQMNLIAI